MEDEELHIAASTNSLHATSKSMKNTAASWLPLTP
jgi:hypothetical protein